MLAFLSQKCYTRGVLQPHLNAFTRDAINIRVSGQPMKEAIDDSCYHESVYPTTRTRVRRCKMSNSSYLRRFKKRMLERGDAWKCHYCGVLFVPENTVNGDPEYYTDKPRQGYFMMHADGSVRPIYLIKDGFCDNPTVDHIHPRSRGGGNELSNLVFACHLCNSKKNNREAWQLAVSE